jgi:hypothetical protein
MIDCGFIVGAKTSPSSYTGVALKVPENKFDLPGLLEP